MQLRYGYHFKLLALATLLSTGVTTIVASYVPEQEIKQVLRKGKRVRTRRIECNDLEPEDDEN